MTRRLALMLALLVSGGCAGGPAKRLVSSSAVADGIPLGALPRQTLDRGQCALFLWKTGEGARLVVMARSGPPPFARVLLDGRMIDLPRLGDAGSGADATARYGDGRLVLALDLTVERREGLSDGALAAGSVRIDRTDGEGFALPVSGLLACG